MLSELELAHAAFDLWLDGQGEDNRSELDRVKRILPVVIAECCTDRQKTFIAHYFGDQITMPEIAERYGVRKSTVSRTISRGLNRIYKYLRFSSPLFINAPQNKRKLRIRRRHTYETD